VPPLPVDAPSLTTDVGGGAAGDAATRERQRFLVIACAASVLLCVIALADGQVAKYRWAPSLLVPIVWAVFLVRRRLALRPLHFVLFVIALVAHDMGGFGWYQRTMLGLQWDWYVHFYFGVVAGLVMARALQVRLGLHGLALGLLTVLSVGGMGALHEIMEAASTVVFGEHGMFHAGPEDPYDTQQDMLNNVLGASLALALGRAARGRERRRDAAPDRGEAGAGPVIAATAAGPSTPARP
jgi:uncharacterized membrane protein YjdF